MDAFELLAHPVRLRVVHAMRGGRELTTAELCHRIRDVSKATVYRHVDLLAAGGVLEVALERRVRGAVERRYRLRRDRAGITTDTANSLSLDEHRSAFAAALAVLTAEFTAYLDRDTADPVADLVGYRQHAVWLSPGELHGMIDGMREAIAPHLANEPSPDRTQYLISPILFPVEAPPAETGTDTDFGSSG
ncbi:helix-turn-helix domain-containing protein [Streptomyces sp. NBC_00264]|uniref:helix-turn-helix domain-containing protein n=1 Tax=unclassified Streptomyces TaxID=2593676 RepID=UPI0022579CD8|nr:MULTISPECIES: helix-turn-helix domain-containing protein [unclassified Streptomyces]WSG48582.1 helix-turn-helix domain-containing protein [Streptomyces sp. NBC_01732]WSW99232.1 helix-turn-helix domain-containing protein [Streptomyces sp. NBC_00987]MCX4399319.1 helix-turn-helix domain-containing protein [Streptomyces sp. NBC_01767]MCX5166065.1 helix-turn-helix domain-containing protein [Streptomyces sp. NBC_00305]MCX5224490.1 helix-turn-helix domain-containing protein [Streptomyces sp. NBC_0